MFRPITAAITVTLTVVCNGLSAPDCTGNAKDPEIVAKHQAVFTAPPRRIPSNCSTDAPLLGNGNLLAALGGGPERLQFFINKNDLWFISDKNSRPAPLARLDLDIPGLKGASYRVVQELNRGLTIGTFTKANATLTMETAIAATENLLWVKLSAKGGTFTGKSGLALPGTGTYDGKTLRVFVDGKDANPVIPKAVGTQLVTRNFDQGVSFPTGAACAMRVVSDVDAGDGSFTVAPGRDVLIALAAASLLESNDFAAIAKQRANACTADSLANTKVAHDGWWRAFWSKSFVEIPDKALEQRYYLSHYALACASRLASFPPDLYGWETTDGPMWGGAYFLNYNFYAPFYGLYAANHIEQADPCIGAIIDATELGHRYSKGPDAGIEGGILLPVSIGAKGSISCPATWHQKSDSSYCCVPIASRWYATYDLAFARQTYPFVRDVAYFWEKWLKLENGRYVDRDDATLEVCTWNHNPCGEVNPLHTLALIKQVMSLAIDMSSELGVDAGRHAKWADIRDRLSDYPTCTVRDLPNGSRVDEPRTEEVLNLPIFRYSEKGPAWQNDNAVGIQHIFPGNGIGLSSPPALLARARNQVRILNRWIDLNGCNSFYPAAVRVGYDPEIILAKLRHWVDTSSANGMRPDNPHGMEQFSVVPCTLQEMLMQSYDGTLRLFPNWPKNQDARFGTLRARGAFLVSAELKGGVISGVKIVSEKGTDCTVQNPWPTRKVQVIRNSKPAESVTGNRFTLKTDASEAIELTPAAP